VFTSCMKRTTHRRAFSRPYRPRGMMCPSFQAFGLRNDLLGPLGRRTSAVKTLSVPPRPEGPRRFEPRGRRNDEPWLRAEPVNPRPEGPRRFEPRGRRNDEPWLRAEPVNPRPEGPRRFEPRGRRNDEPWWRAKGSIRGPKGRGDLSEGGVGTTNPGGEPNPSIRGPKGRRDTHETNNTSKRILAALQGGETSIESSLPRPSAFALICSTLRADGHLP
jgi:hypothetical protein